MFLIRSSVFSGRDIRGRFSEHLFGLCASFFDKRPIGTLMSLATSDVEAIRMAMGAGLLTLADAFFYFITVPIAMYWLSPKLTLIAFLPLPIIPWLVMRNEREIHKRYEKVQECAAEISAMVQEGLNGIRITKAFGKEDAQIERLRKKGMEYARLSLRLARVQTSFGPTLDFAMSLGMVFLLVVGGRLVITEGDAVVTLGTFVAFQRYIQKMVWPMAALGMALGSYQRSVSSSGRLNEVFDQKTKVPHAESPVLHVGPWKTTGRLEFRDLSFSYPGTEQVVLRKISLAIEPGQRVAFVGAIGAGKSTLLSLLPRLYPTPKGQLLIDGIDINDWPIDELRRQVGYVSQEVFLFSESVIENVAYGIADWAGHSGQISSIEEATELANVRQDILSLPQAFSTRVGERGMSLSGGQKQRLTIARALVKKPPILVLDDALSSVDVQTEERILGGLRSRPGRNTELISAHRISTIMDSDQIVVLQEGAITQRGTHDELIRDRSGLYFRFYEQQRLKEDLEQYTESLGYERQPEGVSG